MSKLNASRLAAIQFHDGAQPRVAVCSFGYDHNLYIRHVTGGTGTWENRGAPPAPSFRGLDAISYKDEQGKYRIYVFTTNHDDKLWTCYTTDAVAGQNWSWVSLGKPDSFGIDSEPRAVSYVDEAGTRRIYTFCAGNHLWVCYWNGTKWQWTDLGDPPSTTVASQLYQPGEEPTQPGAITFSEGGTRHIHAFVQCAVPNPSYYGSYAKHWDGKAWHWEKLPGGVRGHGPSVITYRHEQKQRRIYVFSTTFDKLIVDYSVDGGKTWQQADLGTPVPKAIISEPSVVTFLDEAKQQRIYAFVVAEGNLWVRYWDGLQWIWANQGAPAGASLLYRADAVTYVKSGKRNIQAFVVAGDGHLYANWWNGQSWQWVDHGMP